jgi:hypothetical protein
MTEKSTKSLYEDLIMQLMKDLKEMATLVIKLDQTSIYHKESLDRLHDSLEKSIERIESVDKAKMNKPQFFKTVEAKIWASLAGVIALYAVTKITGFISWLSEAFKS